VLVFSVVVGVPDAEDRWKWFASFQGVLRVVNRERERFEGSRNVRMLLVEELLGWLQEGGRERGGGVWISS
jgi:hypothetical protein